MNGVSRFLINIWNNCGNIVIEGVLKRKNQRKVVIKEKKDILGTQIRFKEFETRISKVCIEMININKVNK